MAGSTSGGMPKISRRRSFSKRWNAVVGTVPIPNARAAIIRFSIAKASEMRSSV